jgi:hypothetical protein
MLIATSGSEDQDDESDAPPEGKYGLPNLHVAVVADLMSSTTSSSSRIRLLQSFSYQPGYFHLRTVTRAHKYASTT